MLLSPGPRGVYAAVSGPEGVALVDHFLPRGGKVSESIQQATPYITLFTRTQQFETSVGVRRLLDYLQSHWNNGHSG